METKIFHITDHKRQKEEIKVVAKLLKDGEVVALPTETVYGLAANCFNEEAVKKIFEAKGRPADNPLILHISDFDDLERLTKDLPPNTIKLVTHCWPGPLTVILKKESFVPDIVTAGLDTVAVRMPSNRVTRAIIEAARVPLAAPSANISGFPSPTSAQSVIDDMDTRIAAIVDGGECSVGIESTVVSLAGKTPMLLRPGAVTYERLCELLGKVDIHPAVLNPLGEDEKAASPGMKYKHYSPSANLSIFTGSLSQFTEHLANHPDEFDSALCFEEEKELMPVKCVGFGNENDPLSQAKRLFDALRELDDINAKNVLVRLPSKGGVGLGVCNRLFRAAGFTFVHPERPTVTGITGLSGSGKSYICEILKNKGYSIVDADEVSRKLTKDGSPMLEKIASIFGAKITLGGVLNRKALAETAFANEENIKKLNELMHPEIAKICKRKVTAELKKGNNCILDAPLLFTAGLDKICDVTVWVNAPEDVRLARLKKRDNIYKREAVKRFEAQKKEEELARNADYILNNYKEYDLNEEIKKIF